MLVQQEQALYSLASTKLMNSEPNGNMKMARAGPIAANGRKKISTNIQTPGQPDSYREMQGTIRRLLLAHVWVSLSCQRYHGRLRRQAVV